MKALMALLCLCPFTCGAVQVQTCADIPALPSPSAFGACKTTSCGPVYNTDRVRSDDPAHSGGQVWESWATLAPSRSVALCADGWSTKLAVNLNPPAPLVTPPPVIPVALRHTVRLDWIAPTQNIDGSPLVDLAYFVVYQGTSVSALQPVASAPTKQTALSYTTPALAPGTYFFAITAVNSAGVESAKSAVVSTVLNALDTTPGAPGNVKITVTVTAS